jgi:hypothetical protein
MYKSNSDRRSVIEQSLTDPASVYAGPEEVLEREGLTVPQKIEVLRSWAYDADELAVAEEEGMQTTEPSLLHRVLVALAALGAEIDFERRPPTKQGGA